MTDQFLETLFTTNVLIDNGIEIIALRREVARLTAAIRETQTALAHDCPLVAQETLRLALHPEDDHAA